MEIKKTTPLTFHQYYESIFSSDGLGLCGCGNPDVVLELVRDYLKILRTKQQDRDKWDDCTEQIKGLVGDEGTGPQWLFYYKMSDIDFIEHGGSVGPGAWLTPKGEAYLEAMERFGVDLQELDRKSWETDYSQTEMPDWWNWNTAYLRKGDDQ